jgi:DNA polymerase V
MLPTDNTTKIIGAALAGLKQIYRVGFSYKKTGVLLMGLHPKGATQGSLFDESENNAKSDNLMKVMDSINQKMGKGSLTTAASGGAHRWAMRRELKSPNFTTNWGELPVAW